jgi:hypothetical protein
MTEPATAREALIVEAIGDVARLMRDVESLAPTIDGASRALHQASARLHEELAGFDNRITAITENAKLQTVKHLAARAEEAAHRSIDQQSRAMADAARVAFGVELGATMQRLHAALQPLIEQRRHRWESWLTHAAAAAMGAAATWALALWIGAR